ncbi:MAG: 30S ribosomal protein S18 [Candidatus Levybacteria bacterium]|nr:30S ribosomal protein S18 [Candidatus Levybacteria bacterium]
MKKLVRKPMRRKFVVPKECYFCTDGKEPAYIDTSVLQRFLTERGKIVGRLRSGLCARHQRHLTSAIKNARFLALIPYISRD